MSFDEKNAWAYLVVAVLGYATYLILLAVAGPGAYVPLLLWTVGGSIAANILARIGISIGNPREADKRDQRDRFDQRGKTLRAVAEFRTAKQDDGQRDNDRCRYRL